MEDKTKSLIERELVRQKLECKTNFETRRVQANVVVYATQHISTCHSESEREGVECQPPFFKQHWITLESKILVITLT